MTVVELPAEQPDPLVSVVVLEYDHYPSTVDWLVAQSVYGGYSLKPSNASLLEGNMQIQSPSRRGSVPAHITVSGMSTYSWRIYIDKAVSLRTDLSYSFQGKEGQGSIRVKSESGQLSAKIQSTGRFVGEPNSNWQIDSYNSHPLGLLVFPEAGYYNITLKINPGKGEEIAFQWLWLEAE